MVRIGDSEYRCCFRVPGRPVPKARPRLGGAHVYTPRATQRWEALVGLCARRARPKEWPIDCGYRVEIELGGDCAIVSVTATPSVVPGLRGDVDNYLKAILDGLTDVLWEDDRQVVEATIRRVTVEVADGPREEAG